MKNIAAVFLLLIMSSLSAQFKFESGYYVTKDGIKKDGFIENRDWRFNPSEIKYKANESAEEVTIGIDNITEFGINQFSKYKKVTVDVDMSSDKVALYSDQRKPEFVNKTVLLKVLIEGQYSLYQYEESDLVRFFLKNGTSNIQPLIYKKYVTGGVEDGAQIKTNYEFLQVLGRIACSDLTEADLLQIDYNIKDLTQFIVEANACAGSEVTDLSSNKSNKSSFGVVVGLYSTSFSGSIAGGSFDFGSKVVPSLGFQYELVMPYGGGKWSVLAEPTLFVASGNGTRISSGFAGTNTQDAELNYLSLDIAAGGRFNYYLDGDKKVFFNVLGILFLSPSSAIDFETAEDLELGKGFNLGFGGGVALGKLSGEVRFYTNRNLLNNYLGGDFTNPRIGLQIGYRISN